MRFFFLLNIITLYAFHCPNKTMEYKFINNPIFNDLLKIKIICKLEENILSDVNFLNLFQNIEAKDQILIVFSNENNVELLNNFILTITNFQILFLNIIGTKNKFSNIIINENSSLILQNCSIYLENPLNNMINISDGNKLILNNSDIILNQDYSPDYYYFIDIELINELIITNLFISQKNIINLVRAFSPNIIIFENLNIINSNINIFIYVFDFRSFIVRNCKLENNKIQYFIKILNVNINSDFGELIFENMTISKNLLEDDFLHIEGAKMKIFLKKIVILNNKNTAFFKIRNLNEELMMILQIFDLSIIENTDGVIFDFEKLVKIEMEQILFYKHIKTRFLYLNDCINLKIIKTKIIENTSKLDLFGITIFNKPSMDSELFFINFICYRNQMIYSMSSNLNQGGCLLLTYNGILNISNCTFIDNKVINGTSPCIFNAKEIDEYYSKINLIIANSIFSLNYAERLSNCIKFTGENIEITKSSFIENCGNGVLAYGPIYLYSKKGFFEEILIKNSDSTFGSTLSLLNTLYESEFIFRKIILSKNSCNKALFYIFATFKFKIFIENSYFNKNYAFERGGIFYIKTINDHKIEIFNNIFENNFALTSGGVGELWQSGGTMNFTNCGFFNNIANEGGVLNINAESSTKIFLINSLFISNMAKTQGGVFNILLGNFKMRNCDFYFNESPLGAIFYISTYTESDIDSIKIKNSLNVKKGNLIFIGKSNNKFQNSLISNSSAIVCAGIIISGLANSLINNITFQNNIALSSTLIFITSSFNLIIITNIYAINNVVTNSSLFEFIFAISEISNATFLNNQGSCLIVHQSYLKIYSAYCLNNICNSNQKGCFLYLKENGIFQGNLITVLNMQSKIGYGIIYSKSSTCSFIDSVFIKIRTIDTAEVIYSIYGVFRCNYCYFQNFINTAIVIFKNSYFSYINGVCDNNIPHSNGCIHMTNTVNSLILNSVFTHIASTAIIVTNANDFLKKFILFVENCWFFNNRISEKVKNSYADMRMGACIFLKNSEIQLKNSTFINNTADIGGAIYINLKEMKENTIFIVSIIKNCTFSQNSAISSGGGAIFWDYINPLLQNNNFSNNKAIYGNDFASKPTKLKLINKNTNIFKHFISGSNIPKGNLNFALIDFYDQIISSIKEFEENNYAIIYFENIYNFNLNNQRNAINPENKIIVGVSLAEFQNGYFNFSDLSFVALPNNLHTIVIQSPLILNTNYELINFPEKNDIIWREKYYFVLNATFDECRQGEVFNLQNKICEKCRYGEYSLDIMDLKCHKCPENALCNGGSDILVDIGFWRNNYLSTNIYKCKNEISCLGGINSTCLNGFHGVLCDTCIYNETHHYFKNVDGLCYSCQENYYGYVVIILFLVTLMAYQSFTIRIKIKSVDFRQSCIMKILLNFFQLTSIFNNLDITFPNGLSGILRVQSQINNPKNTLYPVNCVYGLFGSEVDIFLVNNVFICIFSLIYPLFFLILIYIYIFLQKIPKQKIPYYRTISILVVCYTLQPFFINFLFQGFDCLEINSKYYLQNDLTQECWSERHMLIIIYYILPFLVLWVFILPIFAFYFLQKHRKRIHGQNIIFNNPFSFIMDGYRDQTFFWEIIILLQKVIIILTLTFIQHKITLIISCLSILFVFSLFQIFLQPYKTILLNRLQLSGYLVSLFTLFISLCIKNSDSEKEKLFYFLLVLIFNGSFFAFWFFCYLDSNRALLLKINIFFRKFCPWLLILISYSLKRVSDSLKKTSIKKKMKKAEINKILILVKEKHIA